MPATRLKIFISSVQKELAEERRALKSFVEGDPLLSRFFTVFLFEDLPASDRRADAAYLAEVDQCAVYVGIFGKEYGFEDAKGISPTGTGKATVLNFKRPGVHEHSATGSDA